MAQLAAGIAGALRRAFPQEVWVSGELRDLPKDRRPGNLWFSLVEESARPDGAPEVASVRVLLAGPNRDQINRALQAAGGAVRMTDGTRVRVRGRVDWYAQRGELQLRMTAIDPAFTLGQLELQRRALLAKLTAAGLLRTNASRPLALVPLRVGLVTSSGSAAEADFLQQLRGSGVGFTVAVCDARVQGPEAPASIRAAVATLARRGVDVIAVVRGGGARTDLACFDTEVVALAIATCTVPVVTGIGHETDRSIADEVCYYAAKTPTAAAAFLVERVTEYRDTVERCWARVDNAAMRALGSGEALAAARARQLATVTRHALTGAGADVSHARTRVRRAAEVALGHADTEVDGLKARARAHDPQRALARGWSLTRREDGALVRTPADVLPGDRLLTQVAGGTLHSTVEAAGG